MHEAYLKKQRQHRWFVRNARITIFVLFLVTWELTAHFGVIDSFIFSSPSQVMECFYKMILDKSIFHHVGITLYETLISFSLVTTLSIVFATLLWNSQKLLEIMEPFLVALNSLPKSALAPLLIVWLGANQTTIIVAGLSVAIFGSILNMTTSFKEIDSDKLKLIYTLNGTKVQALTKVVIPGSVPSIVSNMKVNIGLCLVGVIIGEFLAARSGLGYLIIYASQTFKLDWVLMSIVLLCLIAMGLYGIIGKLEKQFKQ